MERRAGVAGLILTLNDENVNITDEEAKKLCKRFLSALKIMSKRRGWTYTIQIFFSRTEAEPDPLVKKWVKHKQTAKRPHFHVVIYANPCSTVVRWMRNYWDAPKKSARAKLRIVSRHDIQDFRGFVGYCHRQATFERRQEYRELENGKHF